MKPASQPPHVESDRQSPVQPTQRAARQFEADVPVDDGDDVWVVVGEGDAPMNSVAVGDAGGWQRAAMASAL